MKPFKTKLYGLCENTQKIFTRNENAVYSAPDRGVQFCDERVCLCVCVCPRSCLWNYASNLHQFFMHVTNGHGSVLLWRCSDTLCISSFMDDVIFAHKPRSLDVAIQLNCSAHAAFGLAINCVQ